MSTIRVAVADYLTTDDRATYTLDLATGTWTPDTTATPTTHNTWALSPAPRDDGGWWWVQAEHNPDTGGSTIHVRDQTGTSVWAWDLTGGSSWPSAGTLLPTGWVQAFAHGPGDVGRPPTGIPDGITLIHVTPDGTVTRTTAPIPDPGSHGVPFEYPYPAISHHGSTIAVVATLYRLTEAGGIDTYGSAVWTFDATTLAPVASTVTRPFSTTATRPPTVAVTSDGTVLVAWVEDDGTTVHLHHYTRTLDLVASTTYNGTEWAWPPGLMPRGADTILTEWRGRATRTITTSPLTVGPAQADTSWGVGQQVASAQTTPDGWTVANVMWSSGSAIIAYDPDGTRHVYELADQWWSEIIGIYPEQRHDGILDVPTFDGWWTIGTRDPDMAWEFLAPTAHGWWVEVVAGQEHLADMELCVPAPLHPGAGDDGWVVVALMRPDA